MIRNNLFYKLFALGCALALWAYVNSERNPQSQKTISVPLETRSLAKGYTAEFLSPHEASVTIAGLKTVVDTVRKEDVSAWVNLGSVEPGQDVVTETGRIHVRVLGVAPNDLKTTVSPGTAKVRLEALSLKRLPVEVKFLTAPPLGYSYSDPTLSPASVGVSGKISAVSRVKRIILSLNRDEGHTEIDDYFKVVAVDAKGSVVEGITLDPERVRLKLRFIEVPATKAVIVSPQISGEPKFPWQVSRVSVTPASVTLEGKPSALMGMSTVTTDRISIDGADGTVTKDVAVRVPAGVKVVDHKKVHVTVYLTAAE